MTINLKFEDKKLLVAIEGRLDTTTAPMLEAKLIESLDGINNLVFDFKGLEYVSSAGLRVILSTQKKMNKQGEMKLINVCKDIQDVFDMTGFSDILTIE